MPISLVRANTHVATWTARLPSRPGWPRSLFFSAHVAAAAEIIRDGKLRCRSNLGDIAHDIAHPDAIGTNPVAHNFVRLYFRPRTPFHLRTEGIKLLTDGYRLSAHMSVPILFVFDFTSVVTRPDAQFCERKMAHAGIQPGRDEAYFDGIDFASVYHDSGILDPFRRMEIHDRRMAEVLVPSELPLNGTLRFIICRTSFDALTLQHLIRDVPDRLRPIVRVATRPPETFFCRGVFITDLQFAGDAITLRVNPSNDYQTGKTLKFDIQQMLPPPARRFMRWQHESTITNSPLQISGWNPDAAEHWQIHIEDALAFEGSIPVAQSGTVVGP